MKEEKMLKYMNLLDDKYILEASPSNAKGIRRNRRASKMLLRYGALVASFVIVVGIGLLIPHLRLDEPVTPLDTELNIGELTFPPETIKNPNSHTSLPPYVDVDKEELQDKIDDFQQAIGGSSTYFTRKYIDETYNIAYLRAVYRDETGVISEDNLNDWVNNVYLKQDSAQQSELPTIYQAICHFSVSKEDLIAVNESRKERGSEMILPDEIIDALFLPEEEMKKYLVHPCALYYDNEIYTLEDLNSMSFEVGESVPEYVVENYIDNLIVYCVENEIISEGHISRYFD